MNVPTQKHKKQPSQLLQSLFFLVTDLLSENFIFALLFWSEVQGKAAQYTLAWYKIECNTAFTGLLEFSTA